MQSERRVTERTILKEALAGRLALPPLSFTATAVDSRRGEEDLVLEAKWDGGKARFVAEIKSVSTPKEFEAAAWKAEAYARSARALPMVILPYIRESQLRELEKR